MATPQDNLDSKTLRSQSKFSFPLNDMNFYNPPATNKILIEKTQSSVLETENTVMIKLEDLLYEGS